MKHRVAWLAVAFAMACAGRAQAAEAPRLSEATLVVIDAQREYRDGRMALEGIEPALAQISLLLRSARDAGAPVVHVRHHSKAGSGAFDPKGPYVEILPEAAPLQGEAIVTKRFPDSFRDTELGAVLEGLGRRRLVLAGFMTQQCVSATAETAARNGYEVTVVASATATRAMPDPAAGGQIPASDVQARALERLGRIGRVVPDAGSLTR